MKKILMVSCDGLGNGGVQTVMMQIVRALKTEYVFDALLFKNEARFFDDEFLSHGGQIFRLPNKPKNFDKMLSIAKELSKGFPFLRVDLYEINGKIYFSEFTFFPCSGHMPFEPEEWDYKFGELLNIR